MGDFVEFTIPGRLKGKGRARHRVVTTKSGKTFSSTYTPADTRNTEAMLRSLGAEAMAGRPPFQGPLVLEVTITINTPASWSKKRKREAFYVTGKPDLDNVLKSFDGISNIVWKDDVQLCDVHMQRRYNDTVPESVHVRIYSPGKGEPAMDFRLKMPEPVEEATRDSGNRHEHPHP